MRSHSFVVAALAFVFSSQPLLAQDWSDVKFGSLPLTQDVSLAGKLKKRALWSSGEALEVELRIRQEPFGEGEAQDRFNYESGKHPIVYSLGETTCSGATILTTEDEFGEKIAYSAVVSPDGDAQLRPAGCPYLVQLDLGPGEEHSPEFSAYLTVYPTNDLSKKQVYRGMLKNLNSRQ